jgi:dolichyl-phosphate-mannose--protein O-mannosyl transferase
MTLILSDVMIKKAMFSYMRVKKQDENMMRWTLQICTNGKHLAQTIDVKFLVMIIGSRSLDGKFWL